MGERGGGGEEGDGGWGEGHFFLTILGGGKRTRRFFSLLFALPLFSLSLYLSISLSLCGERAQKNKEEGKPKSLCSSLQKFITIVYHYHPHSPDPVIPHLSESHLGSSPLLLLLLFLLLNYPRCPRWRRDLDKLV